MACIFCSALGHAQNDILEGFSYGETLSPTGKEWESPELLALNKEQPHAWFFSFADKESARKVLPENSPYWKSLDGQWKFHWVGNPEERPTDFYKPDYNVEGWDNITVPSCWNVEGIQKDGSLKYGTPVYVNQPVIFRINRTVGDWKKGVMRTPPEDWTTYKDRNEVGSYRRTFNIPESWKGKEIYINFDGVNSFFYLWINGRYIGFSKNSRNTASFNISDYLESKKENIVAVEVYRNSDGSFLEAQDMFRLPGIFRSVYLTAKPTVQIQDLVAIPNLDDNYKDGELLIKANIRNHTKKDLKGYTLEYSLYQNKLYEDENTQISESPIEKEITGINSNSSIWEEVTYAVKSPRLWSAEEPYRYTLVGILKDKKGKTVDIVSTIVGFREVEIKDTKAADDEFGLIGRYYYINGKPVKLKGVNRQEINPETGNSITAEQMFDEIKLMKKGNINHVRNSHYSNAPIWYFLCDKYGIYLEDESNNESHEYGYGEASLSHVPEFRAAHIARSMELVRAHINSPSIVIWSLGNEGGPGDNFKAAYEAIKAFDSSRPVQYERNNSIVDMGSNQYPSVDWVRGAATGKYSIKYPFHISEYAHSMGNATGNMADYWEAIESTNFICGGAIWDWVDQSIYYYDKTSGTRYFAYGGNFGDKPNDGMFCMNGILLPNHTPKPAYFEVKKVYQNIGVTPVNIKQGVIEIFNKRYFTDISDLEIVWSLYKDGEKQEEHPLNIDLRPREKKRVTLPIEYGNLDADAEYFIKLQFLLKNDEFWAQKGFVQMEEQLQLKEAGVQPSIALASRGERPSVEQDEEYTTIKGSNFTACFDNSKGTIHSLRYGNQTIIQEGNGPKLDAFRAPVDNDNWGYQQWFAAGLHNLQHETSRVAVIPSEENGTFTVQIMYTVVSQAPNGAQLSGWNSGNNTIKELTDRPFNDDDFKFITNQIWTIYPDGSIELEANITSNKASQSLPRLGFAMLLPDNLSNYSYYGRGPQNNYVDRKSGAFIEQYHSTVKEQFVNFPKPQSMGNREEIRWCALTDNSGKGVQFIATKPFAASALPWSAMEMVKAPHPYQLPASSGTHLHIDCAMTGLGGSSCGPQPLEEDKVKAGSHTMGFIIRPVQNRNFVQNAKVSAAGEIPLSITRSRNGLVTIHTDKPEAGIVYTINNNKKEHTYTKPFTLTERGTIKAYYKGKPELYSVITFPRIENIPVEVIFASSQETGEGDAVHLTDGDPSTMWHTVYSVTVAQYPHWVDFDAGEVKEIKGFTYTPRQDGGENGDIKNYQIQISDDGKNWSNPIAKGSFERNKKEKRVLFEKPVKTRYIRFVGLDSQNKADYAGGAEFTILAD